MLIYEVRGGVEYPNADNKQQAGYWKYIFKLKIRKIKNLSPEKKIDK